jgi:hypothetical protein
MSSLFLVNFFKIYIIFSKYSVNLSMNSPKLSISYWLVHKSLTRLCSWMIFFNI